MHAPKLPITVDQQLSDLTRFKVQSEITDLERQLEMISLESNTVDFALVEALKEMIHARQRLLSSLKNYI